MASWKEKIDQLPPEVQREVQAYIKTLLKKRRKKSGIKMKQDWAGALEEYRDQYTSLELQKKALEWRGD